MDRQRSNVDSDADAVFASLPELSTIVTFAWPTGRPVHRYTVEELAEGVDVYTRAMKTRAAPKQQEGDQHAPE